MSLIYNYTITMSLKTRFVSQMSLTCFAWTMNYIFLYVYADFYSLHYVVQQERTLSQYDTASFIVPMYCNAVCLLFWLSLCFCLVIVLDVFFFFLFFFFFCFTLWRCVLKEWNKIMSWCVLVLQLWIMHTCIKNFFD